jgi:DNA-binding response OmpR family regulator
MTLADPAPLAVVADDDEDILTLVSITLRRAGFDVLCARDGEEAITLVTETRPDVVVLDVMMPRLNGLDVTRHLRALRKRMPIILLTASVQEQHRAHGLQAGADEFVRKPFSPRELLDHVERLVARDGRLAG